MDADLRPLLERILARLDAIDTGVQSAYNEAREARHEAREARDVAQRVERAFTVLTQEFSHLTAAVGIIADAQASMSRSMDALSERVDRIVQAYVRARTDEVERYVGIDARLTAIEQKVRGLSSDRAG